MIYLVTKNSYLWESSIYKVISVEDSLNLLQSMEVLAVDTETSGLDCWTKKILTIQIGNKKDQVVVDCTTIDILNYKDLLEDPNKLQK